MMSTNFARGARWFFAGALALAFLVVSGAIGYRIARAGGVPTTTPLFYSGTLEESGQPADGARDITLRLWSDPNSTDGAFLMCTTIANQTQVAGGKFRIPLDATCTQPFHDNVDLWLEVLVANTSVGRRKIGVVPYALEAGRAAGASGNFNVPGALTVTGAATIGGKSIARITQCSFNGAPVGCPGCNHQWVAADCDNGLPAGTCVGMGGRMDVCNGTVVWDVLLPGELGPNGGMSWFTNNACSNPTIRAVYMCSQ
jgi:hypothetical protein